MPIKSTWPEYFPLNFTKRKTQLESYLYDKERKVSFTFTLSAPFDLYFCKYILIFVYNLYRDRIGISKSIHGNIKILKFAEEQLSSSSTSLIRSQNPLLSSVKEIFDLQLLRRTQQAIVSMTITIQYR